MSNSRMELTTEHEICASGGSPDSRVQARKGGLVVLRTTRTAVQDDFLKIRKVGANNISSAI